MHVVPLGPEAAACDGRRASRRATSSCLLCDRDIGRRRRRGRRSSASARRCPAGPATLALRTGAPLLPDRHLLRGPDPPRGRPPARRRPSGRARFRDDVARITQALADELEALIRRAPEQWHLLQPNWPSDRVETGPSDSDTPSARGRRPARSSKYPDAVRIGLVCPYSLTVPGGVQGAGARAWPARCARWATTRGCSAPCDGPPPDAGVTPLGKSVPTAANGSVAPLAPDPSAQLRTIRALRDEAFDVLHLHEPLAPGPDHDHAAVPERADGRHVPRRRATAPPTRWLEPAVRWLADRLDLRCAVSEDAEATGRAGPRRRLRRCCSTASRSSGSPRPTPWPTDGPDDLLRRPPRAAQGPGRPARRACATCRPTCGCGSAATGPRPSALRARHGRRPPHRVARPPQRRREGAPACAAPTCSARRRCAASRSASCCSRRWPPDAPVVASDLDRLPQRGPRGRRRPARARRATPTRWPTALRRVLDDRRAAGAGWSRPASTGPQEFSMDHLAERYLELLRAHRAADAARRRCGDPPPRPRMRAVIVVLIVHRRAAGARRPVPRRPATTASSRCGTASRTPGRRSTCSSSAATT